MAKLIVGLGNPTKQYAKTRHNVGFWCVEQMMRELKVQAEKTKWQALMAETAIGGERVYLMRPQTYMNLSGNAVREAVQFLKLPIEDSVLVVYDDMDLPVGKIRLRAKGGAGGHNGVKSIIENLGTEVFPRIRIGIGRPPFDLVVTDYVLSSFARKELPDVEESVSRAAQAAEAACTMPFAQVMNAFN